jgi:23S rRNA (cytidine1920-2'-O)/16S rRNA (cytidine1409-2'-O)-methyltransferase
MRLDIYLFKNGYAKSRTRAQSLIKQGFVKVNDKPVTKTGTPIEDDDEVDLLEQDHPYVSRGAFKLKGILDSLKHNFTNKNVIDIGSSTGGFCQISLEYGAEHVVAIDVGTDQLDSSLRNLEKLTVLEQTDARNLEKNMLPVVPNILVSDVSFISQTRILPHILNEFKSIKQLYILVKPQFELTKGKIGRGGIVRSKKDREEALNSVINCVKENCFIVKHIIDSPIKGGEGNCEYMLYGERL